MLKKIFKIFIAAEMVLTMAFGGAPSIASTDVPYVVDNFDAYTGQTAIPVSPNSDWSEASANSAKVSLTPDASPTGTEGDLAAKFWLGSDLNNGGNALLKKQIASSTAALPAKFVVSGRVYMPERNQEGSPTYSAFYPRIMGSGSSTYKNLVAFHGNADCRIQNNAGATIGYFAPQSWVHFTALITPNQSALASSSVTVILSGVKARTADTDTTTITNTREIDLSGISGNVLAAFRYQKASLAIEETAYLDDVCIYSADSLSAAVSPAGLVNAAAPVTVKFSHPINPTTFAASKLHLSDASGDVEVYTAQMSGMNDDTFTFTANLNYDTTYTLTLDSTVTDIQGFAVPGPITFTTREDTGGVSVIEQVTLSSTGDLSQTVGYESEVLFSTSCMPNLGVDYDTIEWYVNGVKQTATGQTFAFTPPTAGAYVVSNAVSGNPDAITNSITVELSPPSVLPAAEYINDDFEDYILSGNPPVSPINAEDWEYSGGNHVIADPDNVGNQVLSWYNNAASATSNSIRKTVPLMEPLNVSGDVKLLSASDDVNVDFRDPNTDQTISVLRFRKDAGGNIVFFGESAVRAKAKAGEWVSYEAAVIPNLDDVTHSTVWVRVFGNITDTAGNNIEEVSASKTIDFSQQTLEGTVLRFDCGIPPGGEMIYFDNLKVTSAPALQAFIPTNCGIATQGAAVTVSFTDPVNNATLGENSVIVKEVDTGTVIASAATLAANGRSMTVTMLEELAADTVYSVTIDQDVVSVKGGRPCTMPYFTTGAESAPEPEILPTYVNRIAITVPQLTLWQNFPLELTLSADVYPRNATISSVLWQSDNTDAVIVDPDTGLLTLIAPGVANITANSKDGGGVASSPSVITVTEPRIDDPNQKRNLGSAATPRYDLDAAIGWPEAVGDGVVANWKGNRIGAYSLSQDDGSYAEYYKWLEWGEEYGWDFTFFIPTEKQKVLDSLQTLYDEGQDIESHTRYHYDPEKREACTTAEAVYDYSQAILDIENTVPVKVKTMAYAWGAPEKPWGNLFYSAARGGVHGNSNKPGTTNFNFTTHFSLTGESQLFYDETPENNAQSLSLEASVKGLYDPGYLQEHQSGYGGWTVILCHSVLSEKTNPYTGEITTVSDLLEYAFDNWLKPNEDKIWVDTFTNVALYGQERDTAHLDIDTEADRIVYDLTDEMDDTVFDYPLTVKLKVDSAWEGITATQGAEPLEVTVMENESGKFALIETVPDRGSVTVTPGGAVAAGDIDGDGTIGLSDVIMSAHIAVGDTGYMPEQVARANVSDKNDPTVDIADVVLIAERVVGDVTSFPVEQP